MASAASFCVRLTRMPVWRWNAPPAASHHTIGALQITSTTSSACASEPAEKASVANSVSVITRNARFPYAASSAATSVSVTPRNTRFRDAACDAARLRQAAPTRTRSNTVPSTLERNDAALEQRLAHGERYARRLGGIAQREWRRPILDHRLDELGVLAQESVLEALVERRRAFVPHPVRVRDRHEVGAALPADGDPAARADHFGRALETVRHR